MIDINRLIADCEFIIYLSYPFDGPEVLQEVCRGCVLEIRQGLEKYPLQERAQTVASNLATIQTQKANQRKLLRDDRRR